VIKRLQNWFKLCHWTVSKSSHGHHLNSLLYINLAKIIYHAKSVSILLLLNVDIRRY
jgi:hypothetical protein